jgi:hypothetical protein
MIDEYQFLRRSIIICCDRLSGIMITIWESTASGESKQGQEILNYPSDRDKKEGVGRIRGFHGYLQLEKVVKPDFFV